MKTEVLTVSDAKPMLGKLVDRALRSEPVFIRRGNQFVQLVPAVMPSPVPVYPPGALTRADGEVAALMQTFDGDEAAPVSRP
jgi:hypothetical protein